jgi:hypothetical protein
MHGPGDWLIPPVLSLLDRAKEREDLANMLTFVGGDAFFTEGQVVHAKG